MNLCRPPQREFIVRARSKSVFAHDLKNEIQGDSTRSRLLHPIKDFDLCVHAESVNRRCAWRKCQMARCRIRSSIRRLYTTANACYRQSILTRASHPQRLWAFSDLEHEHSGASMFGYHHDTDENKFSCLLFLHRRDPENREMLAVLSGHRHLAATSIPRGRISARRLETYTFTTNPLVSPGEASVSSFMRLVQGALVLLR